MHRPWCKLDFVNSSRSKEFQGSRSSWVLRWVYVLSQKEGWTLDRLGPRVYASCCENLICSILTSNSRPHQTTMSWWGWSSLPTTSSLLFPATPALSACPDWTILWLEQIDKWSRLGPEKTHTVDSGSPLFSGSLSSWTIVSATARTTWHMVPEALRPWHLDPQDSSCAQQSWQRFDMPNTLHQIADIKPHVWCDSMATEKPFQTARPSAASTHSVWMRTMGGNPAFCSAG